MKLLPAALILAAPLLAVTAAAPGTARDYNDVPPATVTGPPRDCVALRSLHDSRVRNDRVIDFATSGRKAYRVTLPYACPGLGFDRAFTYETSLGQLCKQDIITVLRQTGGLERGASCGLAEFQPVLLAERR